VSIALNVDIILSSMTLGLTLVNCAPRRTEKAFDLIKRFAPPIYVLFFVLVGARLKVFGMGPLALLLVVVYVLGRSIGKIAGAYWGTIISKGPPVVKKYLGICLFAQGGVAIGLSILASHRFDNNISSIVILVVASTTFIVQLAGPVFVKHAVKKAGEVNMNITEQDLIDIYKVADVIDRDRVTIKGNATLDEIITTFGKTRFTFYPVVDDHEKLIGVITIEGIRSTLADTKASSWLLAMDIMSPVVYNVTPDMPLAEVLKKARDINLNHIPVIRSEEDTYCLGILDLRLVKRSLSAEVLSRQQKADIIQTV